MIKKILIIVGVSLLAGYLIFAAFYFESKPKEKICNNFVIEPLDSVTVKYVDLVALQKYLDKSRLNPYGKQIKDINTQAIETAILKNKIVKEAQVYVTDNGDVHVKIKAKEPILRIMSDDGDDYYIDRDSTVMPLSPNFTAYLPIATGQISKRFALKSLYGFAEFLSQDEFWNAQIEQIQVASENQIVLIPRVGNQKIVLGTLDNYPDKLNRLMVFYRKGLDSIGWNNYAVIDLSFDKQVVCSNEKM